MSGLPPITLGAMSECHIEVKEIKCESLGGYFFVSTPFMDEEADLLAWTDDLTYPASAFSTEESNHEELSGQSHDAGVSPNSGRKRTLWGLTTNQPLAKRVAPLPKAGTPDKPATSTEERTDNGESSLPLWQGEAMEDVPAGFENSLSSYSMNDALLSSQSLTVFKQEVAGNTDAAHSHHDQDNACTLQRLLQGNGFVSRSEQDCRFQYVLAAATSIASKQGEDTLTYLNQGQSYGIKLKKVGELLGFKGKLLRSVIRLQFHERRLQYSEKEQILAWQASRPGERIVELDVPLSYGLCDVEHDGTMVNTLSFSWDPTQEVGAYIKVNSISTEFTPKKHGGEKGVPFRIQVETYIQGDTYRLHAAACQIRVFKLKGADRKHKQEREKWLKLPESERAKYQPPFESTVLSDVPADASFPLQPFVGSAAEVPNFPTPRQSSVNAPAPRELRSSGPLPPLPDTADLAPKVEQDNVPVQVLPPIVQQEPTIISNVRQGEHFSVDMGREQVTAWLIRYGFEMLSATFSHFAGTDMMRLSRQDLIHMCGLPNGVRLFYALRSKPAIRLTLYVSLPGKTFYNAVYLSTGCRSELARKLAALLNLSEGSISEMYLAGPNGIHVLITDELLANLQNETSFAINLMRDDASDKCCLLLKSSTN